MEQEDQKCCLGSDTCPELGTVVSRVRPVCVRAGGQWPPPPLVPVESSLPARCKVPWQCASCSCPCSLHAGWRCPRGPAVPAAGWVCSQLRSSLCSSATTMTVRRYSTAAAAPAPPGTRPPRAGKSPAECFSSSSPSKLKLFQEHVRRCR